MARINLCEISNEIIERILSDDCIKIGDLCTVSRACRRLRDVCESEYLWKNKFQKRWPDIFEKLKTTICDMNWRQRCRQVHYIVAETSKIVASMSPKYHHLESELSEEHYCDYVDPLLKDELSILAMIDELKNIVYGNKKKKVDLTLKFYAERIFQYIHRKVLEEKWKKLINDNASATVYAMEIASTYLCEWFEPEISIRIEFIEIEITKIAVMVRNEVAIQHPQHPVLLNSLVKKGDNLTDSKWTPKDCRKILTVLNKIMFTQLGFRGGTNSVINGEESYYNEKNSMIYHVLKRKIGIPISLCILYASIAYRLGVVCLCVNCPAHFMLKFLEYPEIGDQGAYTYIDAFNKGTFVNETHSTDHDQIIPRRPNNPVKLTAVLLRMCKNLENIGGQALYNSNGVNHTLKNALELIRIIMPEDVNNLIFIARLYLHVNSNLKKALENLEYVLNKDPTTESVVREAKVQVLAQIAAEQNRDKKTVVHRRDAEGGRRHVHFKIGLVALHLMYGYKCVIFGWDPICVASQEWIQQMGVDKLILKDRQPFYHVLVEDGSNRYAAQENLEIMEEQEEIEHWEVGRYFCDFNEEAGYVPNEELAKQYPQDDFPIQSSSEKSGQRSCDECDTSSSSRD